MARKKVVVMGGGTGTYQVLTGLKKYPLEISAVISMADSGGSTGRLRKELGILPPGDVRRAILALSDLPFAENTLEELFDFRFKGKGGLAGHSLGNILLAALTQITGSMDKAIVEAARILNVSGQIYPVTLDKSNLVAILDDGTKIFGETKIDRRTFKIEQGIKKIYLTPRAKVFKDAEKAILEADLIVLGPGDLYTSIIPTLLVEGVTDAIHSSKGKLAYVVNLVTKRGETNNFRAEDFVNKISGYLRKGNLKLNWVLVNKATNFPKSKVLSWYKQYGSLPVKNNLKSSFYKVVEKDFTTSETTFFRHDPDKVAKAITELL